MAEVVQTSLAQPQKLLYLNLDAYTSGLRHNRNVLAARCAVTPAANFVVEQTFQLSEANATGDTYTFTGTTGNNITILNCSKPVKVTLTTSTGSLVMGPQTMMVITSPIVSLALENDNAEVVNVEIIHA